MKETSWGAPRADNPMLEPEVNLWDISNTGAQQFGFWFCGILWVVVPFFIGATAWRESSNMANTCSRLRKMAQALEDEAGSKKTH